MTNPVKRYEASYYEPHEAPDGEWVRYDDIKHLLQDEPSAQCTCSTEIKVVSIDPACPQGHGKGLPPRPPTVPPAELRESHRWTPEQIEKAMKEWSGIPLCPECFRPQLYCACSIRASLNRT